jgi:hypothetical protein
MSQLKELVGEAAEALNSTIIRQATQVHKRASRPPTQMPNAVRLFICRLTAGVSPHLRTHSRQNQSQDPLTKQSPPRSNINKTNRRPTSKTSNEPADRHETAIHTVSRIKMWINERTKTDSASNSHRRQNAVSIVQIQINRRLFRSSPTRESIYRPIH